MIRVSPLVVCIPFLALMGCPNDEGPLEPVASADAGIPDTGAGTSRTNRDAGGPPDDDGDELDAGADLADTGADDDDDAQGLVSDAALPEPDGDDASDGGEIDEPSDAGAQRDAGDLIDAETSEIDAGEIADAGTDASRPDAGKPYTGLPDAGIKLPVIVAFEPSPVADASFTAVYAILQSRCRNCHGSSFNYSLDLSTRQLAHEELVSGPHAGAAEFISCEQPGIFRVIPADPGNSLVIQKLFNVQHCGDRMPTNGVLSLGERSVIWTWIARGALND